MNRYLIGFLAVSFIFLAWVATGNDAGSAIEIGLLK